ncbi:hypothetical protein Adt_23774 [Abeliophyllum distichum]|uniref:Uncharacterized protein n=1 Tax=Abeliophyllum distichum TaxID=126358 RepID=A0ABD1SDG1_9LAMI
MSSRNDDSQNQSDAWTNPSIRGESPSSASSSSSSEVVEKVNQAPSTARPSTPSTSGREACPTAPSKETAEKGGPDARVPKMRKLLDKKDTPVAKALDEELKRSATEASMARSRIVEGELEDMQLSYDIFASVILRALGLEERADDPPERFVAIYKPAMQ